MALRTAAGRRGGAAGYTLAAVVIFVAVLNVLIAAALPVWSHLAQREREEELIFRGLQYAEAIRVFQKRFGRYPVRLDELVKVSPRSIRQLWKDPTTPDGRWGIVYAEGSLDEGGDDEDDEGRSRLSRRGRELVESRRRRQEARDARSRSRELTSGPIVGVHSLSEDKAIRVFLDGETYKEWKFTVDQLPAGGALTDGTVPSLNARWVGKPFPAGLEPAEGSAPTDVLESDDGRSRRGKRGRRNPRRGGRRSGG